MRRSKIPVFCKKINATQPHSHDQDRELVTHEQGRRDSRIRLRTKETNEKESKEKVMLRWKSSSSTTQEKGGMLGHRREQSRQPRTTGSRGKKGKVLHCKKKYAKRRFKTKRRPVKETVVLKIRGEKRTNLLSGGRSYSSLGERKNNTQSGPETGIKKQKKVEQSTMEKGLAKGLPEDLC